MNSKFYTDYFLAVTGENGDIFPQVHIADIKRLPILPGLLRADSPLANFGAEMLECHKAPHANAERIAALKTTIEEELAAAFGI